MQAPATQAQQAVEAQVDSLRNTLDFGAIFNWQTIVGGLIRSAVIIVLALVIYRLITLLTRRIYRHEVREEDPLVKRVREQRAQTVAGLLNNVALVTMSVIVFLLVLSSFGLDISPLLATAGIAGLAISFGAQSVVKDVITGAMIIMEGQYAIGDVVQVGDVSGLVEKINLRTTVLRDLRGVVHVIPNGQISVLSNMTKGWSRAVLDIGVAYKEDVDRVMDVLREIGAEMRAEAEWGPLMMEDVDIAGVDSFGDSAVVIRMLAKTLPLKQWTVGRELRRRIKKRFDAEGIEIPFPHVTFYWGEGQLPSGLREPGGRSDSGRESGDVAYDRS